jgi:DnaJ-class molecular chaperone
MLNITSPLCAPRDFVCGTRRAATLRPGDHRVYCATCGAGGAVRHATREQATSAAVRDSAKPCRTCGAS